MDAPVPNQRKLSTAGEHDSIRDRYESWVGQTYHPHFLRPDRVTKFVSPESPEETARINFTLEDRVHLYVKRGYPVAFNGGTGTAKTTLLKNVAIRQGLPFYKDIGYTKFSLERALAKATLSGDRVEHHPAELGLALLHQGLYFLEEAASIDTEAMVDLHEILEGGSVRFHTQFGNFLLDTEDVPRFRFVMAGNFGYQHANFTPATIQRFVWLDGRYLPSKQFEDLLYDKRTGVDKMLSDASVEELNRRFEAIYSQEPTDQELRTVSSMLTKIRDRFIGWADKHDVWLDQNLRCFERALFCYSPGLTTHDYKNIIDETVIYPLAGQAWYAAVDEHDRKQLREMRRIAWDEISAHRNVFSEKRREFEEAFGGTD